MIEAIKFEGLQHVVCQCDKCKAEKQEPVAWLYIEPDNPHLHVHCDDVDVSQFPHDEWFPVYKQPKREWVGLTTGEMEKLAVENGKATFLNDDEETGILWFDGDCFDLLKAAEAKLKEKNT